jgi:hypothetical protein
MNPINAAKAVARVVGGIAGKGAKNVNPIYREMNIPPAPPGGKPFNPTPPAPPTSGSIAKKPPHVPEKRDGAIENQNPKTPKKPTTPNGIGTKRGQFSGNLAPYNWTGN